MELTVSILCNSTIPSLQALAMSAISTRTHTYKQRFVGCKYHHLMKVEVESDNDRPGKVLYALANSPVKPAFRLGYWISRSSSRFKFCMRKTVPVSARAPLSHSNEYDKLILKRS